MRDAVCASAWGHAPPMLPARCGFCHGGPKKKPCDAFASNGGVGIFLQALALVRGHAQAHQSISVGHPFAGMTGAPYPLLFNRGAIQQQQVNGGGGAVQLGYRVCFILGDPSRSLTLSHIACRWRTGPSTSWRPSIPCRSTPGWRISRTASTPGKACCRALTTEHGLFPPMQFLLLGVLQKVPDSRQQKSGGKVSSPCVSEVRPCGGLAACSPFPAPHRLGQPEAGYRGTQPSTREALNTHPLKFFYYI